MKNILCKAATATFKGLKKVFAPVHKALQPVYKFFIKIYGPIHKVLLKIYKPLKIVFDKIVDIIWIILGGVEKVFIQLNRTSIYIRIGALVAGLSLVLLLSELDLMKYSTVSIFAYLVIFTIVAMGLNILLGYSGLMSLGTAGFVGFGAYGVVYFEKVGLPFELAAIATMAVATAIGLLIGLFSLKVEGVYLAIATLAVGEIFSQIFKRVVWFTNAFGGVHYKYPTLLGFMELERELTYIFLVIAMGVMMVVMHHITKSKTGRAMLAMSRSQSSAQAMGVSISKYKLLSFIIAILYATIGGVLYASFYRYVQPLDWSLMLTLLILAMVVVGGMKSIFGTFIGVFIIYGVPKLWLEDWFSKIDGVAYIFSGVLIIIVVMFYPYGMIHLLQDIKKNFYRLKIRRHKKQMKDSDLYE